MRVTKRSEKQFLREPGSDLGPFTVVAAGGQGAVGNVVVHVGELNLAIQWFDAEKFLSPKPVNVYEAKDWTSHKITVQKGWFVYVKISKAGGVLKLVARKENWASIPEEEKKPHDTIWIPLAEIEDIETVKGEGGVNDVVISIKQIFKSDTPQKKEYWNAFEPVMWRQDDDERGPWKAVFTPGALHMSHERVDPFDPLITFASTKDGSGVFMKKYPICDVEEGDKFYLNFEVDGPNNSVLLKPPRFEKHKQTLEDAREKRPSMDPEPELVEDEFGVQGYYSIFIGEIKKDGNQLYWEAAWRSDYIYHRDRRFGDFLSGSGDDSSSSTPSIPDVPSVPSDPETDDDPMPENVPHNPNPNQEYYIVCNPPGSTDRPSDPAYDPTPPGTTSSGASPDPPASPPECVIVTGNGTPKRLDAEYDDGTNPPTLEGYFQKGCKTILYWDSVLEKWVIRDDEDGKKIWVDGSDPDNPLGLYFWDSSESDPDQQTQPTLSVVSWDSIFGDENGNFGTVMPAGPNGSDETVWVEGNDFSDSPEGPEIGSDDTEMVIISNLDVTDTQALIVEDGMMQWRGVGSLGRGISFDYTSKLIIDALS